MGILRVILALIIVMEHTVILRSFDWIIGPYALKIFFMMSGFYMTLVLDRKYVGKGSYSLFLTNRLLRLFPIYWATLAITVIVGFLTFLLYNNWGSITPYVVYNDVINIGPLLYQFFVNIFLFGQDLIFLFGFNPDTGSVFFTNNFNLAQPPFYIFLFAPHAWSLGIELTYYMIAPYLTRRSTKIVLLLIALSLLLRWYLISIGLKDDPWNYRFFPNELVLFLVGTLSYRLYKYIEKNEININLRKLIVLIFFIMFFFYNYIFSFARESYLPALFFFSYAGITLPFLFQFSKNSKFDYRVGELSYPIYIIHIVVLNTITLLFSKYNWQFNKGLGVVIVTLILSYLLMKFVSDPIEKIRRRRTMKS